MTRNRSTSAVKWTVAVVAFLVVSAVSMVIVVLLLLLFSTRPGGCVAVVVVVVTIAVYTRGKGTSDVVVTGDVYECTYEGVDHADDTKMSTRSNNNNEGNVVICNYLPCSE